MKPSSETDLREKSDQETNIKDQYTHGVGKSGRSHLIEDRGEAGTGSLDCRRHLLQRNGLCRHRRAIAGRHGLPHLQQKGGGLVVKDHCPSHWYATFDELISKLQVTELKRCEKEHEKSEHKESKISTKQRQKQ